MDPLTILLILGALAGGYQAGVVLQRRRARRRARVQRELRRERSPARRRRLQSEWSELGGSSDTRRARRHHQWREVREAGERARSQGMPLSANPYGVSAWGKGREWKRGWRSVDRNIRWLHRFRRRSIV